MRTPRELAAYGRSLLTSSRTRSPDEFDAVPAVDVAGELEPLGDRVGHHAGDRDGSGRVNSSCRANELQRPHLEAVEAV